MFRLLRYFSITSLLAFITVTVVLGALYHQTAVSDLVALGENHNVALTQAFANSLWPQFEPFVNAASGQSGDELRANSQTTQLYNAVLAQMKGTTVVKVKVYNLDGLTVFSTQASQIGEDKSGDGGFQLAASGTTASELTHQGTFSAFENTVENIDVLSSYIPILRDGQPTGVFEIYTDITPLLRRIDETQRNITLAVTLILVSLYLILFLIVRRADNIIRRQYGEIKQAEERATQAQETADKLLLNIFPGPIVERLKYKPGTIADIYQDVTVLFADIVDFTRLTAHDDPADMVGLLNNIFTDLDGLAQKYGLEKIKTIGDAYMVAGGIPVPRDDHAEAIANMALDILEVLTRYDWHGEKIHVRIGINSGPVVAGVIGRQKFIYDLWGDAVNIASRMESNGMPGVIQVTRSTYEKLKSSFQFEKREPIQVKGKGEMETYLLRGRIV
jgi:class 3 adenylate cyclase